MITVLLYGFLGKKFGKKHKLAIKTPAEAVRALCANYPKFKQQVINSGFDYKVLIGEQQVESDEALHLQASKTIKIVPLVSGSGGLGKIFAGIALIVLSFYLPGAGMAGFSLSSVASSVGFSLVLGGLSQILFSPPKTEQRQNERPENKPSYAFNGAINTTGQGNPVPIAYGTRIRVGSQVISAGLSSENLAI